MASANDSIYTIKPVFGMRHPVSGLLHAAGAVLAAFAMVEMLGRAHASGSAAQATAATIYGVAVTLLFGISALYHLINGSEKLTGFLRQLDHSMIFVIIAATYTPMFLVSFSQPLGTRLCIGAWSIALFGVLMRVFVKDGGPRKLRSALYVGMGWLVMTVFGEVWHALGPGGFAWLLGGGIVYNIGAIIYARKWPDPIPEHFGFHEIWHLLVLAGSACHYWMIRKYVMGF